MDKKISVIIPAFNEQDTINVVVEKVKKYEYVSEVIVVDNLSTDKTAEVALKSGAKVVECNIQGKGYSAYNSILSSFDTLISLEEVIESNLRANNIENITTLELIEAMTRAFPNAYPFLNGVIANIISSSFFLTKIENEGLPDYSWMIFPILRGLEGVIKKMLLLKGIRVDKHFGEVFEPISSGSTVYRLKGCHSATMDSKHSTTIEKCYNYFVANRHGIFHVNSSLSTTRQIRREEAIDIFNELVELIENSYLEIMS